MKTYKVQRMYVGTERLYAVREAYIFGVPCRRRWINHSLLYKTREEATAHKKELQEKDNDETK